MILTASAIVEAVNAGQILIDPFDPKSVGPNSYDVRLDRELVIYESEILDPRAKNLTTKILIGEEGMIIRPGELYLASTIEKVGSKHFIPCLEGRSSLARLGLSIHQTAGFGDVGFISRWTMEISVVRPVRIYAGMRIGQFAFHGACGSTEMQYAGKYGQTADAAIEASKSFLDREVVVDGKA